MLGVDLPQMVVGVVNVQPPIPILMPHKGVTGEVMGSVRGQENLTVGMISEYTRGMIAPKGCNLRVVRIAYTLVISKAGRTVAITFNFDFGERGGHT